MRWLLERIRIGLLVGLGGAALVVLGGRSVGFDGGTVAAGVWVILALSGAAATGLSRWPDDWAVARAADGLGLEERVASALHAVRIHHPAASLLAEDAAFALRRIDPRQYPLLPQPRRWRPVPLLALALTVASLAPLPMLGDAGRQAAEARTVAATRQSVEALQKELVRPADPQPLAVATGAELRALEEELRRSRDSLQAARALEQAQERLAALARSEDYAWQRTVDRLSSTWTGEPDLGALSRALSSRDSEGVEEALSELSARAPDMSSEERQQLQLALQSGANVSRDLPELSAALREAAGQVASAGAAGEGDTNGIAASMDRLADLLSQGAARSQALQTAQQAVAGLGQARAALGSPSGISSGSGGAVAAGPPSGSASGGQAGQGTGGASGAGSSSGSGSGSGTGSGSGSGSGAGSGSGSGSGSGGAGGSGSGSGGAGGSGGGSGAGAGAGGGPSPGRHGSGNSGATLSGGQAPPGNAGPVRYDSIFAPSLMGGEGGPRVQAPGDAAGASGDTAETPNSPMTLGSVRPYDQVYGQYEAAARDSLSRRPLPPALQGLVQRYFSSIAPEK